MCGEAAPVGLCWYIVYWRACVYLKTETQADSKTDEGEFICLRILWSIFKAFLKEAKVLLYEVFNLETRKTMRFSYRF